MGETKTVSWPLALAYAALAIGSFHLAFALDWSLCIVVFLFCLVGLTNLSSGRTTFYFGLVIGICIYAPHLAFFWGIFKWTAIVLWLVPSFWLAVFLTLSRSVRCRFGTLGLVLIPFLWLGIEYFRSELYYLKFSWLSVGYAFSYSNLLPYVGEVGVYGIGFCFMLLVVAIHSWRNVRTFTICLGILAIVSLYEVVGSSANVKVRGSNMPIAGVQLETPAGGEVPRALDRALAALPYAQVFVLSEYTFHMPIPNSVRKWCAQHGKYLIVGGSDPLPNNKFYDTDFVIGPKGDVVFKQAKCVPVQFFDDGLAAQEQKVWESPWGKIGMGVCYDCSYRRVTDELVRQGAQALIFPTMDANDWGAYEHRLHARVGPMRASEFRIPVIRLASSGISQIVRRDGTVVAQAGYPGQGEMILGNIGLGVPGRLPLDHWLGPICSGIAGIVLVFVVTESFLRQKTKSSTRRSVRIPVTKL